MSEKYDFSKSADQQKFEQLPQKERDEIVGEAREEAAKMQEKIKSGKARDYTGAKKLIKTEKGEIILTPEQQAAKQELIRRLSDGSIDAALEIIERFSVPQEVILSPEIQQAAKQGLIGCLSNGYIDAALKIIERLSVPQEVILSPEIQQAAEQGLISRLFYGHIDTALKIIERLSVSKEVIQQATKQGLIRCLSDGHIDTALEIIKRFSVSQEVIQQAVKQGLISYLSYGDIDAALKIIERFSVPQEVILSPEIQQAAKQGLIRRLSNGYIDAALKIKDKFNIRIEPKEIIDKIPKLQNLLNRLQEISPEFYSQALKSIDIVISLIQFKDNPEQFIQEIQESPFLLDAISENPRFGSKLLIKYPQFDELSKQNIETLFDAKKEILANNPDIEPTSLEFRQLMQEKLKEYKNNPEILKAMQESGINIDEWLNYSETKYFNLEGGDSHLVFSETIQAPINRIKETLDSYTYTLKNVLKEYKPELSEFKIPLEDAKEIEATIAQLKTELAHATP